MKNPNKMNHPAASGRGVKNHNTFQLNIE